MVSLELPAEACRGCEVAVAAKKAYKEMNFGEVVVTQAWMSCIKVWDDFFKNLGRRGVEIRYEGMRGEKPMNSYVPMAVEKAVYCAKEE